MQRLEGEQPPIRHWVLMCIVTMTSVSGFIATDIFLPALPDLKASYQVSAQQTQTIFSVFLYALAGCQLLYGPVSDAIGRRVPMLMALGAYTVASLAIPYSKDFYALLMWRALQGVGACGAIVIGRAIVGDVYRGERLTRFFLSMSIIVGMSPALAPVLGQQLFQQFGWQACFIFTGIFGAILFATVSVALPETRARELSASPLIRGAIHKYQAALAAPGFKRNVAIICVSQAAYFAYLSESTFLLISQGFPTDWLGYSYISLSIAYVAGNMSARHLSSKVSASANVSIGFFLFLAAGVFLSVGLFVKPDSAMALIGGVSVLTFANGFLLPLGTAAAIGSVPAFPGSASGLAGFCQLFCAAVAAQVVGIVTDHNPGAFGLFILVLSLASFALYIAGLRTVKVAGARALQGEK